MNDPEEVGNVLIPYTTDENGKPIVYTSVWCADASLMMFTNLPEEKAAILADGNVGHIYFFAELVAPGDEETHIVHRDAESGQFVSDEYTEQHPDTTVTEER